MRPLRSVCSLLPLLLLLLLLLPHSLEAGGKRRRKYHCYDKTPVCESDRFDVVFSHYDDDHCKVYKCQCRIPDTITCPQGSPQEKTDSHGCKYYECISCPVQQLACRGSQISVYKGDDANGCPLRQCECPPNPTRPQCNSNEELQQLVDDFGCPYYQCRQVRAQCPEKPSCSNNQELVSAGFVGNCEIFKCECLTPRKPACSIGSQPRLQDDGLGCQEYRCVENRSPCPPEPDCPSQYQVVVQDGVDANNCVKYVCKCMPLAPITCPDGYRMELATDEACGCQYYKCEPNCEEKPNCASPYQHAVVMATRSNGCPSYSCVCREPEVISCSAADAHLTLTTATDGSGCEIYVCQTGGTRSGCVQPNCANPVPTGQLDSSGCPIYSCNGGNRNGGSCTVPNCPAGQTAYQVGYLRRNCPQYECQATFCPQPNSCSVNQFASVATDARGCLIVTCTNSNRNGGGVCGQPPVCSGGTQPQAIGQDQFGCTQYVCTRSGCPLPQLACGVNQEPIVSGYDASGCPIYSCSSRRNGGACPAEPLCNAGEILYETGVDGQGCPEYVCVRAGCPRPPTCTVGEVLQQAGFDVDGCRQYVCQSTTRSCGQRPNCGIGQQPQVVGYDSASCPIYSCPGGTRSGNSFCPPPNCGVGQSASVVGVDGLGCEQYVCLGGTSRSGGSFYLNGGFSNNINFGGVVRNVNMNLRCPQQPDCQYHQFRVRAVEQLADGQVCTVYSCTNLGSYHGKPRKCLDNPSYCDSTQTIETYTKRTGKHKKCQKVVCKGASNAVYY